MATEKQLAPAYVSFKSLTTFFNDRREAGHGTDVVDRSLMSNFSGSTGNELITALRYLKFIDSAGKPSASYEQYVQADDTTRKGLLAQVIKEAYPFVFDNAGFNIERATTATTTELFRNSGGISGSTLSRAISFFLAATKEAGIKVSPSLKAPPLSKTPRQRKEPVVIQQTEVRNSSNKEVETPHEVVQGHQVFEIPIPINRKVRLTIPADWSSADWDLFQTMLNAYIVGWKAMANVEKDKGLAPTTE